MSEHVQWPCGGHKYKDVGLVCGACHDSEVASVRAEVERLRAALKSVEWSGRASEYEGFALVCPRCGALAGFGVHNQVCELANALKDTDRATLAKKCK